MKTTAAAAAAVTIHLFKKERKERKEEEPVLKAESPCLYCPRRTALASCRRGRWMWAAALLSFHRRKLLGDC
ncbi:hypothetical protein INR49_002968 [Caranx melampygus]|nr:hypothetical protein INR49_002968 [Caranx melampygus]